MRVGFISLCWIILFCSVASAADTWFAPEFCEFKVNFPTPYKPKQMLSNGVTGAGATARVGNAASFGAECWLYEHQLPLDQFAKGMETQARSRGVSVSSVIIDRNSAISGSVILTGVIKADGRTLHIKSISHIGLRTRLDLTIVDNEITNQAQLAFRNSVKVKK